MRYSIQSLMLFFTLGGTGRRLIYLSGSPRSRPLLSPADLFDGVGHRAGCLPRRLGQQRQWHVPQRAEPEDARTRRGRAVSDGRGERRPGRG